MRWERLTDVDENGKSATLPHLRGLKNGDIATSRIKQVRAPRLVWGVVGCKRHAQAPLAALAPTCVVAGPVPALAASPAHLLAPLHACSHPTGPLPSLPPAGGLWPLWRHPRVPGER